MLAGALVATGITMASAATRGRNVPTYTSGPAKWAASAQAEDGNNQLYGRGAALETKNVKGIRVKAVKVQKHAGSTWTTVLVNNTDVVSNASRAYAVSTTPAAAFCAANPAQVDTYRVVNEHRVLRSDNIAVERVTVSGEFQARRLASASNCQAPAPPGDPVADLEIDVQGASTMLHDLSGSDDQPDYDLDVLVRNLGPGHAGNATAIVDFSPGLAVTSADSRAVLRTSSADPNDYLVNLGLFGAGEVENIDFDVRGAVIGGQFVKGTLDGSVEPSDHDTDTLAIQVIPAADLSLVKSVSPGYVYSGGQVTYTFTVHNAGPDVAHGVTLTDNWPTELSPPSVTTPGNVCDFDTGADRLRCEFGDVAVGGTEVITVTAPASSTSPVTVVNTATVEGNEADPDSIDRAASASFGIGIPAAVAEQVPSDEPTKGEPEVKPEPADEAEVQPQPEPEPESDPQPEPVVVPEPVVPAPEEVSAS